MGPDYVRGMCHDIEDPTFDATAVATNARAQVRPIHRPPRQPADRTPHCAWTVTIDPAYPEAQPIPALAVVADTRAATWPLPDIDRDDDGTADYTGPLLSDVDFGAFSRSALVRIADEVCLQMHLLNLSFVLAVGKRAGDDKELATSICTRQLTGIAGVAAERIHRAMNLSADLDGVAQALNCTRCSIRPDTSDADVEDGMLRVRRSPADDDGSWISLCSSDSLRVLCRRSPPPSTRAWRSASPVATPTGPRSFTAPTPPPRNSPRSSSPRSAVVRPSNSSLGDHCR
jgi:hypothetical protein